MRPFKPVTAAKERFRFEAIYQTPTLPINLEDLPAPLPIEKVTPDQLIEDVLISTLRRLQETSSPEVSAAAARYISLLSENAL